VSGGNCSLTRVLATPAPPCQFIIGWVERECGANWGATWAATAPRSDFCPCSYQCCCRVAARPALAAGATGFTGRLVAEHLARDYKTGVKWALAGRNQERLEKVRLDLSEQYGSELQEVPILLGDIKDQVRKAAGNVRRFAAQPGRPLRFCRTSWACTVARLPVLHQ
jgi:hypothetical protein